MKKFLIATCTCLLLTLSFAFTVANTPHDGEPRKKVQVIFNPNTGFTELGLIQAEYDKLGIHITYRKIEYNEAGRLISLSIKVNCSDGFSGTASTDRLDKNSRFGFCRDYSENTKTPFAIGAITPE